MPRSGKLGIGFILSFVAVIVILSVLGATGVIEEDKPAASAPEPTPAVAAAPAPATEAQGLASEDITTDERVKWCPAHLEGWTKLENCLNGVYDGDIYWDRPENAWAGRGSGP